MGRTVIAGTRLPFSGSSVRLRTLMQLERSNRWLSRLASRVSSTKFGPAEIVWKRGAVDPCTLRTIALNASRDRIRPHDDLISTEPPVPNRRLGTIASRSEPTVEPNQGDR